MSAPDFPCSSQPWRVELGDVRAVLRSMPAESAHCVVTSPPYWGLRAYGTDPQVWGGRPDCDHEWGAPIPFAPKTGDTAASTLGAASGGHAMSDEARKRSTERSFVGRTVQAEHGAFCQHCGAWRGELGLEPDPWLYLDHLREVFREVYRVLRRDGTLWLNMGDSWTGSGRGRNADGTSGATGPGSEKQRSNRGTQAEGIVSGRRIQGVDFPAHTLLLMPFRVADALQEDGWWLRQDIIWHKPAPMPESVRDRPTQAHEHLLLFAKRKGYFYDMEAIREPLSGNAHDRGDGLTPKTVEPGQGIRANASYHAAVAGRLGGGRQRAIAKQSQRYAGGFKLAPERRDGCADLQTNPDNPDGRNARSVWTINTEPSSDEHYASYPTELARRCVAAATSERGVCPACGAPWRRVVNRAAGVRLGCEPRERFYVGTHSRRPTGQAPPLNPYGREVLSAGWQPSCRCDAGDPVPAVVLDPFCGTASTGVAARRLGRRFLGIELLPKYHAMSERRLRRTVAVVRAEQAVLDESPQQIVMFGGE